MRSTRCTGIVDHPETCQCRRFLRTADRTLQLLAPPNRVFWEPVVDGVIIPDQPRVLFESGAFHRVPTIIGFNRDEGWGSFITRSFPSGVSLAVYEGWVTNEFGQHASSVLDLYPTDAFPSPIEAMSRVVADAQFACEARRLARAIERTRTRTFLYSYEYEIDDLWTRFAATGNPNSGDEAGGHWPAFKHPTGRGRGSDKFIILDTVIREGLRPREAQCDFFEPFFFRSLLGGLPASVQ